MRPRRFAVTLDEYDAVTLNEYEEFTMEFSHSISAQLSVEFAREILAAMDKMMRFRSLPREAKKDLWNAFEIAAGFVVDMDADNVDQEQKRVARAMTGMPV
jgi:hypothetical protein